MSVDEATFYGGATYTAIAATLQLYINSKRCQRVKNTSGSSKTVILADGWNYRTNQTGGPHFYVINDPASSQNVVVQYNDTNSHATTLATLTPGQVLQCFLTVNDPVGQAATWRGRKRTIGTVRTATHGSRASIANAATATTYNPNCFDGTDCDFARFNGNVPLDGQDGRHLVIAPMFQDVVQFAKNSTREPIRAADLVMPSVIPVTLDSGCLTPDATHPLAGTTLSPNFYTAYDNGGKPHPLIYDTHYHGTSRHWHHIRYSGTDPTYVWSLGTGASVTVKRHVWKRIVNYVGSNGTTYQLEIRMVMEHLVDAEPTLSPSGSGGKNNRNYGAWGALFNVYVFTNELSPSFADGNSYTPAGSGSAITFTKADPCVWGGCVSEGQDDKFCHPQMVLCGNTPTNFQAPMGSNYVPWYDRQYLKSFEGAYTLRGKNREYCYIVSNGAPWTPGGCGDPAPAGVGIVGNVVFGWTLSGSVSTATMSTGGGFPTSKPTEFLCWENGRIQGRTYFVPSAPGWNEVCGYLDVAGGSCGTITFCVSDDDGIDDGSGHKVWSSFSFVECTGHPDEPFEGYGGGHNCFNNNGASSSTGCCLSLVDRVTAVANEVCTKTSNIFGDINGGGTCDLIGQPCVEANHFSTQAVLDLEDYTYVMNGNQDSRAVSWIRYLPDPTQTLYDYTYSSSVVGDFSTVFGSFTLGVTNIDVTGHGGSGLLKALLTYKPAAATYRDVHVTVTAKKCTQAAHAVGLCVSTSGATTTGYLFILEPISGTTAHVSIYYYVGDVTTLLATETITNLTSDVVAFDIEKWGTDLTFKWTVTGHPQETLTAQDCSLTDGKVAFGTISASNNVEFASFVLVDNSVDYVTIEGALAKYAQSLAFDAKLMAGYGQCTTVDTDPTCGTAPNCNCTSITEAMVRETSTSRSHAYDLTPRNGSTDGENPTWCGGDQPLAACDMHSIVDCPTTYCGDCPAPFVLLSLCIPTRCRDPFDLSTEPKFCRGIAHWYDARITCF